MGVRVEVSGFRHTENRLVASRDGRSKRILTCFSFSPGQIQACRLCRKSRLGFRLTFEDMQLEVYTRI